MLVQVAMCVLLAAIWLEIRTQTVLAASGESDVTKVSAAASLVFVCIGLSLTVVVAMGRG